MARRPSFSLSVSTRKIRHDPRVPEPSGFGSWVRTVSDALKCLIYRYQLTPAGEGILARFPISAGSVGHSDLRAPE
jgi:hypothetical protein